MRGFTILELLIAMMIAGILLAISIPHAQLQLDRVVVHSAREDVRAALSLGRTLALAGHARVVVSIDSTSGTLRIRQYGQQVHSRGVAHAHGVRLVATRDSLVYNAHGVGHGAANLSIIVQKRAAAETVFVSRLGRIR